MRPVFEVEIFVVVFIYYPYYYFGTLKLASWQGVNNSNKTQQKCWSFENLIVYFLESYLIKVSILYLYL